MLWLDMVVHASLVYVVYYMVLFQSRYCCSPDDHHVQNAQLIFKKK
jgi:hypothetical protein